MNNPKCKNYKPIDETANADCTNCKRWAGTRCIGHQTLIQENAEIIKHDSYDHMMRDNKGVRIE